MRVKLLVDVVFTSTNILVGPTNTARAPILVSALGEKAFQLAGGIANGALSWVCPVSYLLHTGLPALRKGADIARRSASPPTLVAHVLVALTTDRNLAMVAGHRFMDMYARLAFYVKMFTSAGFPTTLGSAAPDTVVDSMVISGNEDTVTARFSITYCGSISRRSANVTFAQAATLPVAGLTALHAVEKGGLLLHKRVLITGSTGGVGLFAHQLARAVPMLSALLVMLVTRP